MSFALPAVNGLIAVMGRVGQVCAVEIDALPASTMHASAARQARVEIMVAPLCVCSFAPALYMAAGGTP
jgi:hypothetical protein